MNSTSIPEGHTKSSISVVLLLVVLHVKWYDFRKQWSFMTVITLNIEFKKKKVHTKGMCLNKIGVHDNGRQIWFKVEMWIGVTGHSYYKSGFNIEKLRKNS